MFYKKHFFLLLSLLITINLSGQNEAEAIKWLAYLDKNNCDTSIVARVVWAAFLGDNTEGSSKKLFLLEQKAGGNPSKQLRVQMDLLKAIVAHRTKQLYDNRSSGDWGLAALEKANELGDERLIAAACGILGCNYLEDKVLDKGLFYQMKYVSLLEKLNYDSEMICKEKIFTTSYLYTTHNYEACQAYCTDFLTTKQGKIDPIYRVSTYNNLGLCYRATGKYDLALQNFNVAKDAAQKDTLDVWIGILNGNIGTTLKFQNKSAEALPYWQNGIKSSVKFHDWGDAAISAAHLSEYLFTIGEKEKALKTIQQAAIWADKHPNSELIVTRVKAFIFKELHQTDSAFYYQNVYNEMDKANLENITKTRYEQIKLMLDFDKNTHQYKLLRKEQEAEIWRRNLLLGLLLTTCMAAWLLINRQRLKSKLAQQQQQIAENEVVSAKEQLALFTQIMIANNEKIDELNGQLHQFQQTNEDELIHQTILTEDDWNRFKSLFEKAQPRFFDKIKTRNPDITAAELRLAALIKLNLDNKQMASIQGISVSSIRGNKTRLRYRLNITTEDVLEDFIKAI
jgi:DNA-binding CsgD family transcriptional regulator